MGTIRVNGEGVYPTDPFIPPSRQKYLPFYLRGITIMGLLILSFGLVGTSNLCLGEEATADIFDGDSMIEEELVPAFCMNSSVMNQLLQGFGSLIMFDESTDINLLCGSLIVREELHENRVELEVVLECNCVSESGDCIDIDRLEGNWVISFKY